MIDGTAMRTGALSSTPLALSSRQLPWSDGSPMPSRHDGKFDKVLNDFGDLLE